jgi:hypothetical protein
MFNELKSSSAGLIPHQPMPPGAQDFSKRVSGLLDGQSKDEVQVKQALEGMDALLDAIAAGMYSLASMLVGEGEDGVRLVETAVATAEVSACEDAAGARKNSRRALVSAGLDLLARREPGCLAAPEGIEPAGGCIEDDELEAAGVSLAQLEQMIGGPDRDRVRAWLAGRGSRCFCDEGGGWVHCGRDGGAASRIWRAAGDGMERGRGAVGVPARAVLAGFATTAGFGGRD